MINRILIAVCAGFIFFAIPAKAATLDFIGTHSFDFDDKKGHGGENDWRNDKNSSRHDDDNYSDHKSGKGKKDDFSWDDDFHFDKSDHHSKGGDFVPPPIFSTSDTGKWRHEDKDDRGGDWDDEGHKHHDDDRDGHHGDYKKYYREICDRHDWDGGHHHHHNHGCDPGSPVPLPGALPLFGTALMILAMTNVRRKAQAASRIKK